MLQLATEAKSVDWVRSKVFEGTSFLVRDLSDDTAFRVKRTMLMDKHIADWKTAWARENGGVWDVKANAWSNWAEAEAAFLDHPELRPECMTRANMALVHMAVDDWKGVVAAKSEVSLCSIELKGHQIKFVEGQEIPNWLQKLKKGSILKIFLDAQVREALQWFYTAVSNKDGVIGLSKSTAPIRRLAVYPAPTEEKDIIEVHVGNFSLQEVVNIPFDRTKLVAAIEQSQRLALELLNAAMGKFLNFDAPEVAKPELNPSLSEDSSG